MERRIHLSTQLLITVKSAGNRQKKSQRHREGLRLDLNPVSLRQKSRSLVDALGNIIPAGSSEIIAA